MKIRFPTGLIAIFAGVSAAACGNVAVDSDCDPGPPAPRNAGWVTIDQLPPGAALDGSQPSDLSAIFLEKHVEECVVVDEDEDCQRVHCDSGWLVEGVAVDAGELTITGGLVDVAAGVDGYNQHSKGPMFEPGDVLQLALAGNEDFAPVSVTLEAPPVPVVAPLGAGPILRDVPLTFTWDSAPGPGTVRAFLITAPEAYQDAQAIHPGDITESVICEAPISSGSLTMPVSLLSTLPPSNIMQADVEVRVWSREVRERDGWRLDFHVGSFATTPTGGMYWYSGDLQ